jgi:outer membrane protein assembly factor BamA
VDGYGDDVFAVNRVENIPINQRFWLGGDTLGPRGFESRSISPRRYVSVDSRGNIMGVVGNPVSFPPGTLIGSNGLPVAVEVGGDRMWLFQSEFVFPLNEQAETVVFFDAGDSLFEDQSFNFDTTRASVGVELRFHLPIFPVPLRLIYGVPVREIEGDETGNFAFSVGRSF